MAKKPEKPAEKPAAEKKKPKWMEKMLSVGHAADVSQDAWRDSIQTPSPMVNFALGCKSRTGKHGLPRGYTWLIGGQPKGGKTALVYATIGQLHRDNPRAVVVRFDTELKEEAAMSPEALRMWGIDPERYICYMTNDPVEIFDWIAHDLPEMLEEMAKDDKELALLVIDSVNEIQGKRAAIADRGDGRGKSKRQSVLDWQIGDQALVLQEGFKKILPMLRRNRIACILTCHVGAEFDEKVKMKGPDHEWKLKVAKGLQHQVEIWSTMTKIDTKAGTSSAVIEGLEYVNRDGGTDTKGKSDSYAQRFRLLVLGHSFCTPGRAAEFTYHFQLGLWAQADEVCLLGKNRQVLREPGDTGSIYSWGGKKWNGIAAALHGLEADPALCKSLLEEIYKRDREKTLPGAALDSSLPDVDPEVA